MDIIIVFSNNTQSSYKAIETEYNEEITEAPSSSVMIVDSTTIHLRFSGSDDLNTRLADAFNAMLG
ncbi:MAG: hypothetical protein IJH07_09265 [Ruminococcus sp.]|nr:hypothetical protein [Ruminococcus sp.]